MVFVRLPLFNKALEECSTLQDKLIFSLRHAHELKAKPEQFGEEVFDKIFDIAQIARFSKEERAKYEANMMNQRDQYAALKCARDEGEAHGVAIGREETARNMLGKGVEPALVASYTNLSLEAIEALR
jgi:predicted transposase/invertase (TIGR01784 family)